MSGAAEATPGAAQGQPAGSGAGAGEESGMGKLGAGVGGTSNGGISQHNLNHGILVIPGAGHYGGPPGLNINGSGLLEPANGMYSLQGQQQQQVQQQQQQEQIQHAQDPPSHDSFLSSPDLVGPGTDSGHGVISQGTGASTVDVLGPSNDSRFSVLGDALNSTYAHIYGTGQDGSRTGPSNQDTQSLDSQHVLVNLPARRIQPSQVDEEGSLSPIRKRVPPSPVPSPPPPLPPPPLPETNDISRGIDNNNNNNNNSNTNINTNNNNNNSNNSNNNNNNENDENDNNDNHNNGNNNDNEGILNMSSNVDLNASQDSIFNDENMIHNAHMNSVNADSDNDLNQDSGNKIINNENKNLQPDGLDKEDEDLEDRTDNPQRTRLRGGFFLHDDEDDDDDYIDDPQYRPGKNKKARSVGNRLQTVPKKQDDSISVDTSVLLTNEQKNMNVTTPGMDQHSPNNNESSSTGFSGSTPAEDFEEYKSGGLLKTTELKRNYPRKTRQSWSELEVAELRKAVEIFRVKKSGSSNDVYSDDDISWKRVAGLVAGRSPRQCRDRWREQEKYNVLVKANKLDIKRGHWDKAELENLIHMRNEGKSWKECAEILHRTPPQCRLAIANLKKKNEKLLVRRRDLTSSGRTTSSRRTADNDYDEKDERDNNIMSMSELIVNTNSDLGKGLNPNLTLTNDNDIHNLNNVSDNRSNTNINIDINRNSSPGMSESSSMKNNYGLSMDYVKEERNNERHLGMVTKRYGTTRSNLSALDEYIQRKMANKKKMGKTKKESVSKAISISAKDGSVSSSTIDNSSTFSSPMTQGNSIDGGINESGISNINIGMKSNMSIIGSSRDNSLGKHISSSSIIPSSIMSDDIFEQSQGGAGVTRNILTAETRQHLLMPGLMQSPMNNKMNNNINNFNNNNNNNNNNINSNTNVINNNGLQSNTNGMNKVTIENAIRNFTSGLDLILNSGIINFFSASSMAGATNATTTSGNNGGNSEGGVSNAANNNNNNTFSSFISHGNVTMDNSASNNDITGSGQRGGSIPNSNPNKHIIPNNDNMNSNNHGNMDNASKQLQENMILNGLSQSGIMEHQKECFDLIGRLIDIFRPYSQNLNSTQQMIQYPNQSQHDQNGTAGGNNASNANNSNDEARNRSIEQGSS